MVGTSYEYLENKCLKKKCHRDLDDFYVPFGRMINFQTRKGQFDLLSDVFNDAKERANEGLNRFLSKLNNFDFFFSY